MSVFTSAEIAYLRGQLLGRLATVGPGEIRGVAEVLETGGAQIMRGFAPQMFRITPRRIVSWGIDGEVPR